MNPGADLAMNAVCHGNCFALMVSLELHEQSCTSGLKMAKFRICKVMLSSTRDNRQSGLDPAKSKWHDGQRRINEPGKCIRKKYSLAFVFRLCARLCE